MRLQGPLIAILAVIALSAAVAEEEDYYEILSVDRDASSAQVLSPSLFVGASVITAASHANNPLVPSLFACR